LAVESHLNLSETYFHIGFDSQVLGDALNDQTQVPRCGVAVVIEHPAKGFFAQAGLPRQLFETDVRVDKVSQ